MSNSKKSRPNQRDSIRGELASGSPKVVGKAMKKLKSERTYSQAKKLLDELPNPFSDAILRRCLYSEDWNGLYNWSKLPASTNWIQEVGWLTHTFRRTAGYLQRFIIRRQEFGASYITGKYDKARSILDDIEKEFGKSYWLLERRLMLAQDAEGFAAQKQLLTQILEECETPYIKFIAWFSSFRIEPHVSHDAYRSHVEESLKKMRSAGKVNLADSIEYQISPWSSDWGRSSQRLLNRSLGRPLIDRYILAIKVISLKVITLSETDFDKKQLMRILLDLEDSIKDPQISQIIRMLGGRGSAPPIDLVTQRFLDVHDLLITERFSQASIGVKDLLIENPLSFDNYYLFVQVQIASGQEIESGFIKSSISHEIIDQLSRVVKNEGGLDLPLLNLVNLASRLGDNHLGLSIWKFVESETTANSTIYVEKYSQITSKSSIGGVMRGFSTGNFPDFAKELAIEYQSSPTAALASHQLGGVATVDHFEPPIAGSLVALSMAARAKLEGNHREIIGFLSDFISHEAGSGVEKIYKLRISEMLFSGRMALGQFLEAAEDIVRIYSGNSNNLRHVAFERLIELGKEGDCDQLIATTNWPVLVLLNNGDEQDIYESVDDFLASNGLDDPHQILERLHSPLVLAERVLMRDILVPKVIERSAFWVSSIEDQRQLRSELLQKLYEVSEEDQEFVVNELSLIEEDRLLEADYLNVEGPKFLLDFTDVNRRNLAILTSGFNRYLIYRNFEIEGGMLEDQGDLFKNLTEDPIAPSFSKSQLVRSGISDIMLERVTRGLFGGYLWDTRSSFNSTLGTRIRHGSFENQLTRAFETANFLAAKNLSGVYECPPELEQRIQKFAEDDRDKVTAGFIDFTAKIHALCENLVAEKLRITVPEELVQLLEIEGLPVAEFVHREGLIDFSRIFDSEEIKRVFHGELVPNVGVLIGICKRLFDGVAAEALEAVREYIDGFVAPFVVEASERLEKIIHEASGDVHERSLLAHEVAASRDAFSYDLRIIKNWFFVVRNIEQISGSFESLAEMAFKVVNFASSGRLGSLRFVNSSDLRIEGLARVMIYEVLLILLRNAVKHSKVNDDQEITFTVSEIDRELKGFEVTNLMRSKDDLNAAIVEARECITLGDGDGILARGSGRTGLRRIPVLLGQISTSSMPTIIDVSGGGVEGGDQVFIVNIKMP